MNKRRDRTPYLPMFLALPLSWLYACVTLLRRFMYDHKLLSCVRISVPVISVGGLEAGGSGKTPVAGYILSLLLAADLNPGLLSRGYGRPTRALFIRNKGEPAAAEEIGDEPAMLVHAGLDVPVAAYASRRKGAKRLWDLGCDSLVLDDGFAHRALARDCDIVVLRGEAPFANGHLLPWGPLREPPSSLSRAQVVWLHYRQSVASQKPRWWQRYCPQALWVTSSATLSAQDCEGKQVELRDRPVVIATGVARPHDVQESAQAAGAVVKRLIPFADHYRFRSDDVGALAAACEQESADLLVTAKDAIKLRPLWQGKKFLVLKQNLVVHQGAEELRRKLTDPGLTATGNGRSTVKR